eukprot:SM001895S05146  [mRNA]  locus=s1895:548:1917:- [translate_table: standard]
MAAALATLPAVAAAGGPGLGPCSSYPCGPVGVCSPSRKSPAGFTCLCDAGYTQQADGLPCEETRSSCVGNPCGPAGTCVEKFPTRAQATHVGRGGPVPVFWGEVTTALARKGTTSHGCTDGSVVDVHVHVRMTLSATTNLSLSLHHLA